MIKFGQFSTPENSAVLLAVKVGLHLKNQKSEGLLSLQKRYCGTGEAGARVVFAESLLMLYALGKIAFDEADDMVVYSENS